MSCAGAGRFRPVPPLGGGLPGSSSSSITHACRRRHRGSVRPTRRQRAFLQPAIGSDESGWEAIAPEDRPAILRRYLAVPPGARPHVRVDRPAPLEEFGRISPPIPVFKIVMR